MAPLTAEQRRTRERVETVIAIAAPFLNAVLAVGERISRIAEPEDSEYYPVRSGLTEGDPLRRSPAEARRASGD